MADFAQLHEIGMLPSSMELLIIKTINTKQDWHPKELILLDLLWLTKTVNQANKLIKCLCIRRCGFM